jgi:hypothetical protein
MHEATTYCSFNEPPSRLASFLAPDTTSQHHASSLAIDEKFSPLTSPSMSDARPGQARRIRGLKLMKILSLSRAC